VSDRELRDQFTRDSLEAEVSFVTLKSEEFKKKVPAAEADLRAYFEKNKDRYKISEQRKIQYLALSTTTVAETITVTQKEIEDAWAREPKQDTVNASHILFSIKDPSKEAEIRAKAEGVLKRAKTGEDFAELAKTFSDDPGSKLQGGNLGSFARGRMVKEFEEAAFSLKPGEISDLVRSQFGYHIIKVLKHETPTLETRRKALERQVQLSKASELLKQKSQEAQQLSEKIKDLNAIAKELKIQASVKTTGLLGKSSDPFGNGISQALLDEIFKLKEINSLGKVVEIPDGYALPKLVEVKLPRPSEFADARPQVEKDYTDERALELAKAEARNLAEDATKAGDLDKAAKKRGLTAKTTQKFKRDASPDPDIGTSQAFAAAAFETAIGSVSSPITLEDGKRIAVLQVKSRNQFDEAAFEKQRPELRERLLSMWRETYFQEYIRRIQDDLEKAGKIRINPRALEQIAQTRY
jgi:peptidyl-prolyl cis-trans isomerase D